MQLAEPRFFDPRRTIAFSANRLLHGQQTGGIYFVTFRLADALPKDLIESWRAEREAWRQANSLPRSAVQERDYRVRFTSRMERSLDAGHGECVLRHSEPAMVVADGFRHFDGERYHLISWVVMPNHAHCLFALRASRRLERVLHGWKRFTATRINALTGQSGHLWQRDYFDRLVRDPQHLARCVRYIRHNPEKAKLHPGEYLLYESDLARGIE